ncbi:response regulator [Oceanisphaera avium]|uniref:Response regulator n=1 Tax=Oceanisphaera avium TaxID=1903694 RepID=A0A1Y0D124_9GAMM|nr:response regulator [Oceanisphaera avium]ART81034.1 response regulator [Oceanisphaera avium]
MTTNILICDDSLVARKHVANALPKDWDVTLHYAQDGEQALSFLQENGADLLFLDLNMPIFDGYEVLNVIKAQNIPVMTIVISGDIQELAQQRVRQLGAIGFVKKPLDSAALCQLLSEYGLYSSTTAPSSVPAMLTEPINLFDELQEMANIAMGQASSLLSKLLGVFIEQPIPKVALISPSELNMALTANEEQQHYAAVCQGFVGSGIAGEALMLFSDTDRHHMAELLKYEEAGCAEPEVEVLMDMANILFSAFIKGLGEQLDIAFGLAQPHLLGRHQPIANLVKFHGQKTEQMLCIEIPYKLEKQHIHCNLLVLLTADSVTRLEHKLTYLME